MNEVLSVRELTVKFAAKNGAVHTAVGGLSLSLEKGASLAVVGESGSGKTTLLRAVMGLAEKTSGTVTIFGEQAEKLPRHEAAVLRRRCGYVPQDPYGALPPGLSALDAARIIAAGLNGAGEAVSLDEVAAKLPFYESNKISDEDWRARIALRQKLIGERMVG